MRVFVIGAVALVALQGCATTTETAQVADPELFGRVDCQLSVGNPKLMVEYEQAMAICKPRAEAAAVAAGSNIPVGYGMGGAIASGIQRGMTEGQVGKATAISCMAERGYILRKSSEHEAVCASIKAQEKPQRATPRPRQSST